MIINTNSLSLFLVKNKLSADNTIADLIHRYTFQGIIPTISETNGIIKIDLVGSALIPVIRMYNQALDLSKKGDFDNSLKCFHEVIKTCSFFSLAYSDIAEFYWYQTDDSDTAFDYASKALQWDHDNRWASIIIGKILEFKADHQGAEDSFRDILFFNPDDSIALNFIGLTFVDRKRYDDAIDCFNKALVINPGYVDLYTGMVFAYAGKGDFLEAFEWGRKGILKSQQNPCSPESKDDIAQALLSVGRNCLKLDRFSSIVDIKNDVENEYNIAIELIETQDVEGGAMLLRNTWESQDGKYLIGYNPRVPTYAYQLLICILYVADNRKQHIQNSMILISENDSYKDMFISDMMKEMSENNGENKSKFIELIEPYFRGLIIDINQATSELFLSQEVFEKYTEFRPQQFFAFLEKIQMGVDALEYMHQNHLPESIQRITKQIGILRCLAFKDKYGADLSHGYKPNEDDFRIAQSIYDKYVEIKNTSNSIGALFELLQFTNKALTFDKYLNIDLIQE